MLSRGSGAEVMEVLGLSSTTWSAEVFPWILQDPLQWRKPPQAAGMSSLRGKSGLQVISSFTTL